MALEARSVALRGVAIIATAGALLFACASPQDGIDPSLVEAASRYVLTVRADGPRWLGPTWWQSLGLDVEALDPESVQLFQGAGPVPLLWADSPDGPGALFYGQAPSSVGGAAGVYVLALDEDVEAVTPELVPLGEGTDCQTTTQATQWLEEDLAYRPTAPLESPWLWQSLRPPERFEVMVRLPGVLPSEPISLTVRAWGQSAMPQDPDHHLRVTWNEKVVVDHFWDGNEIETWSLLLPGTGTVDNTLVIEAPGETEAPVEVTWIDALEVTWLRALALNDDAMRLGETSGVVGVWRAESDGVACWQVDDGATRREGTLYATEVALLSDAEGRTFRSEIVVDEESGIVRAAQRAGDVGWIGVPWTAPAPDYVRPEETLADGALDGATYVVIAPAPFHDALGALVAMRQSEGYVARLVTPGAVYDTFGRGLPEASAIQTMVRELAGRGDLRHLLLVGDASPDVSTLWAPEVQAVPTGWARTTHVGHTASDYALATGGTDEVLVAVGRFPVSSLDELERVVGKTLAWRPSPRLLLVNDDEAEFAAMIKSLGEGQDVDLVLDAGADSARRELLRWLGDGPGTLVYSGHGSLQLLGDEKLLTVEDGRNWQQPAVVVSWSCLCANFTHPTQQSLGEALLLAPKGVTAFVGPTGETTTSEQVAMAAAFQTALAEGRTVGEALLKGWRVSTSENSRQGFLLLGDPALSPMPSRAGGTGDN